MYEKHLHITGNGNSIAEKYQTQSIIFACLANKQRFFNASRRCLVENSFKHTQKELESLPIAVGDWQYRDTEIWG